MKQFSKTVFVGFSILLPVLFFGFLPQKVGASVNLISNPDFEVSSTTGDPLDWSRGGFGISSTTFTYPSSGVSGSGARVDIANMSGSGDAKWIFAPVPVVAGHQYTYSDEYSSNVTTQLVAEYFDANHTHISFGGFLGVVPSTSDSSLVWRSSSTEFIPPVSSAFMTVFHTLESNGTLSLDNASLVEAPNPIPFDQGIVSITFDDGWASQYNNAFSEMKINNVPATYFVFTTPMHDSARNFFTDPGATADMVSLSNDHGTTWSPIYLAGDQDYFVSIKYTSDAVSTISVSYVIGTATTTITSAELPAGTNLYGNLSFHLPSGTNPGVSISHTSAGNLAVAGEKYIEANASGYMGPAQLRELQRGGNEIAVHTRDHCNLVFVEDPARCSYVPNPNPSTLGNQINGAQDDLIAEGLTPANTIAYPYGVFNSSVTDFLSSGGRIIAGRTINIGYNYKNTNKYSLKVQIIDDTTTPSQVEAWVNSAETDKSWLVLVFHQIDNPAALASNNEDGGTTPEIFKSILDYIRSRPVLIKTVGDVVANLMDSTPSTDTTPPVISAKADVTEYTNTNAPLVVIFDSPSATDDVDVSVSVSCSPTSGSQFSIGTTTVNCSSTDSSGNTGTSSFNIGVVYTPTVSSVPLVEITPTTIPNGNVGLGFSKNLVASTTANGPFVWTILDGALPNSLGINPETGVISGNPSVVGNFTFTVFVTNGVASTTRSYNMSIGPTPEAPVSSGGGGSNGPIFVSSGSIGQVLGASTTSVEELMKKLKDLYKLLISLQFKVAGCSYSWNSDLSYGSTNSDVKNLQIALNFSTLTTVATIGSGSKGNETIYFRNATRNAVIKFQNLFSDQISDASGVVGPSTRAILNNLCKVN